jgi:hypothetical protein
MTVIDRDFESAMRSVRSSPRGHGRIERIVRRPDEDRRESVGTARLDMVVGLEGDSWQARGSRSTPDGSADVRAQITLANVRVLAAIEPDPERWALAGDQLYVDYDLSEDHLPTGTRLAIGDAVLEVSDLPHRGCAKFSARFGSDALRWINSPTGRALRMRGMNARIVQAGTVRIGDAITIA